MNIKKYVIVGIVLLLVITGIAFVSCEGSSMRFNFDEIIDSEYIGDISLTIYYVSPWIFSMPWSIDDVIRASGEQKIVISGNDLEEHLDLFRQINNYVLVPVRRNSSHPDIRIYYVLESRQNGRLLDVAMWGRDGNMVVNGIEVREAAIFYDVVIPFLPEDIAELLTGFSTDAREGTF